MTYIGVEEARALGRPPNAETLRHPVRSARATAERVAALRPDGADEHQILDAVLVFDLLANLIELDRAARAGRRGEVSPDFVAFGAAAHPPWVSRILSDDALRDALLPGRSADEAAALLASLDSQVRRASHAFGTFWDGIADRQTSERLAAATRTR